MALLDTVTDTSSYLPPANVTTINREFVKDIVTIIDPVAVPLLDLIAGGVAESTIHQFAVDSLPALVTNVSTGDIDVDGVNTNGLDEGFEPNFSGTGSPYSAQPQRLTNVVQIFGAKFAASDSLQRSRSLVGVKDPIAHEKMKAMQTMRKAMERRMFEPTNFTDYSVGSATLPRRMRALIKWIDETGFALNQVTANGQLTPDLIDQGAEACKNSGGRPTHLFVGVGTKFDLSRQLRSTVSSTQTVINTSNIDANEMRIIRSVDWYVTDGGPIQIVSDFQIPESNSTSGGGLAWLLEVGKLSWDTYVPLQDVPLAKTGYNTKGLLAEEATYAFYQPASSCVFHQVTT